MIIKALKSKIHRATVTKADLDYVGSISIDAALMKESNLLPFEHVHVLNITNGNRLETYVIEAPANSGMICINGAAAHLVSPKDLVIIVSYCEIEHSKLPSFNPSIIHVDEENKIVDINTLSKSDTPR